MCGIYRQLYEDVKAEAKTMGARYLDGGVAPGNLAVRTASFKLGRFEQAITVREAIG